MKSYVKQCWPNRLTLNQKCPMFQGDSIMIKTKVCVACVKFLEHFSPDENLGNYQLQDYRF